MKLAIILGTRPEAIKLAPVAHEARRRHHEFESIIISTGQHREMLDPALNFFGISPDHELALMNPGQSLATLTSRVLQACDDLLPRLAPDAVVVQGDTTTAMAGALAAFYLGIPVAHVEAGLRTDRLDAPFPEELNRRAIGQIAQWHFAPTQRAKEALLRDHVQALGGEIFVTGNTGIDAVLMAAEQVRANPPHDADLSFIERQMSGKSETPDPNSSIRSRRPLVLVTGHRRENFGQPFEQFCLALLDIARHQPDALLVYPVHLNPNVHSPVRAILGSQKNVLLIGPKDYPVFVKLMLNASLVITDSGGVQEEAPALGKPVIVTRETTERPEAVDAGMVRVVGTDRGRIVANALELLAQPPRPAVSPYGDGQAARRCLNALLGLGTDEFRGGA